MFRVNFIVTAVASLALAAVAFCSPYAVNSVEAATPEASTASAVAECPPPILAIREERVGTKIFTTGKAVVKATPARVWEVLTDYDGAAGIFSNLTKSKLLSSSGPTKFVGFTAVTLGNLFKFDYILEVTERQPDLIEWKRASGAFQGNEGYWKLEPLESGKATLVTYAKHVAGGFFLPQALVKKLIRSSIPIIFAELKTAAESPNVIQANLSSDANVSRLTQK